MQLPDRAPRWRWGSSSQPIRSAMALRLASSPARGWCHFFSRAQRISNSEAGSSRLGHRVPGGPGLYLRKERPSS